MSLSVSEDMRCLQATLKATEDVRRDLLERVKANLWLWKKTVLIEKSVLDVLNMLDFQGSTALAECWAPKADWERIQGALMAADESSGAQVCVAVDRTQGKFAQGCTRSCPMTTAIESGRECASFGPLPAVSPSKGGGGAALVTKGSNRPKCASGILKADPP